MRHLKIFIILEGIEVKVLNEEIALDSLFVSFCWLLTEQDFEQKILWIMGDWSIQLV